MLHNSRIEKKSQHLKIHDVQRCKWTQYCSTTYIYKQRIKLENTVQWQEQRFQLKMLMMSKCLVEMQHMNGKEKIECRPGKKRHTFQCFRFILSLNMHATHKRPYILLYFDSISIRWWWKIFWLHKRNNNKTRHLMKSSNKRVDDDKKEDKRKWASLLCLCTRSLAVWRWQLAHRMFPFTHENFAICTFIMPTLPTTIPWF